MAALAENAPKRLISTAAHRTPRCRASRLTQWLLFGYQAKEAASRRLTCLAARVLAVHVLCLRARTDQECRLGCRKAKIG